MRELLIKEIIGGYIISFPEGNDCIAERDEDVLFAVKDFLKVLPVPEKAEE